MGLMISVDRRIPENVQLLKEGKWEKGMFAECNGLKGRIVGLLGIGFVGKEVCKRSLAFDMKVIAYDPYLPKEKVEEMGAVKIDSWQELVKTADVISVHVPSTPETKKMINKDFLAMMKPDAILLNTARGDLVVEEDLIARLNAVSGFWYGTDVPQGEPAEKKAAFDCKIAKHPKCIVTHHIGASTKQAETAIGIEAVRMVKVYGESKKVENCVNLATDVKTTHAITIKYVNEVGILGGILAEFSKLALKIQELKNEVFKGRFACVSGIHFAGAVDKKDELVAALKKIPGVLDVTFVC
jgi:D-3-phosphoglycerate dehydrogenase